MLQNYAISQKTVSYTHLDVYKRQTQDNNAIVAPVGSAWKQMRDSFPSVDLYVPDESHPSASGTYLAACVFYASIFHKNPMQTTFNNGLATTCLLYTARCV